jgi:endonuclease YncB( thermonuclease family)
MSQLADDFKMDPRRLYNMVEMFRAFEKLNTYSILTFSHYLEISRVEGLTEREALVSQSEKEGWSVRELKAVLGERVGALAEGAVGSVGSGLPVEPGDSGRVDSGSGVAAPVPRKGRLHTYRLLEGGSDNGKEVKLDLGFRVRLALQAKATYDIEPGRVVECVADSKGQLEYAGRRYRLIEDNKPRTKLYTYGAQVLKVIDGDTMWVEINCGFGVSIEEKLRLRGIDTPEIASAEGVVARLFAAERLKVGATIALTTSRSDLYDRYLADVYYVPDGADGDAATALAEGRDLNRELIEEGLATPMG